MRRCTVWLTGIEVKESCSSVVGLRTCERGGLAWIVVQITADVSV